MLFLCQLLLNFQGIQVISQLRSLSYSKITAEKAIEKIKWHNHSADQYCFKNERALSLLIDKRVITQYKDNRGIWK